MHIDKIESIDVHIIGLESCYTLLYIGRHIIYRQWKLFGIFSCLNFVFTLGLLLFVERSFITQNICCHKSWKHNKWSNWFWWNIEPLKHWDINETLNQGERLMCKFGVQHKEQNFPLWRDWVMKIEDLPPCRLDSLKTRLDSIHPYRRLMFCVLRWTLLY